MSEQEQGLVKSNPRFTFKRSGIMGRMQNNALAPVLDTNVPNKIGIVFDDSGSMGGQPIEDAHSGIDEFVKNCNSNDTALAIYPLNAECKPLNRDFAEVAFYGMSIPTTGGTPLFKTLEKLIDAEPITRAVAFSDGSPDMHDLEYEEPVLTKYTEKKIPIDTIYIGSALGNGAVVMKRIAERTGGIFLQFTDASVLRKSLKYLAPAYRAMLGSGDFKKKVEEGKA